MLELNQLPVFRGHLLTDEDLIIRTHILNLMCSLTTSWSTDSLFVDEIDEILSGLKEMENDGLVAITPNSLTVTPSGRAFLRNICMAFDLRLKRDVPETQLFSMTV
jgi:oxygen-independent coproporphyrinogen-3 oxidase